MFQILEVGNDWNILKCTLHLRRVQKVSIILAVLEEFLVNSLLHETKISTMDMRVMVYFNFSKKKFEKKSPSSIRNGKFYPPKCRGQGLKYWRGNSRRACHKPLYSSCLPFWANVVTIAPAHARLLHASPKNIVSP